MSNFGCLSRCGIQNHRGRIASISFTVFLLLFGSRSHFRHFRLFAIRLSPPRRSFLSSFEWPTLLSDFSGHRGFVKWFRKEGKKTTSLMFNLIILELNTRMIKALKLLWSQSCEPLPHPSLPSPVIPKNDEKWLPLPLIAMVKSALSFR